MNQSAILPCKVMIINVPEIGTLRDWMFNAISTINCRLDGAAHSDYFLARHMLQRPNPQDF
jgi:hypothetical protein